MAKVLNIETATTNCSVSISDGGVVVALSEQNDAGYSHAENLHLFILDVLKQADLEASELDAIAVSKGPGSYTGLRIGVSTAKGLCFALDKPLIAVETLTVLASQFSPNQQGFIVPLLDARRMEVYSGVYNQSYEPLRAIQAEIIDEHSFAEFLDQGKVFFIGDGALKCQEVLEHENAVFQSEVLYPSAREVAVIAEAKYKVSDFEDVAYFEPFYLKDFIGVKTKS